MSILSLHAIRILVQSEVHENSVLFCEHIKTMKWHRIWGITIRHLVQFSEFNKLSSTLYWPFCDILIFGYLSLGLLSQGGTNIASLILLFNVVFWQFVNRANLCVSLDFLEEIWSSNITNLFATPLTLGEWICATFVDAFIVNVSLLLFCAILLYFIFGVSLLILGWWIIPFFLLTLFSGFCIGVFTTSFLLIWGNRDQSIAWMVSWGFALFSGVFYPLSTLPLWLQKIACALPFCHTFEAISVLLKDNVAPWQQIFNSFVFNGIYTCLSLMIFFAAFANGKRKGLSRLRD